MSRISAALSITLAALSMSGVSAFYVPGVKSETFKKGDEVQMKVNAVTSIHTQIPKPYYRLPFCKPEDGIKMASENLGEFLTGNKVQNSPCLNLCCVGWIAGESTAETPCATKTGLG